jgi:hypothetical protein
VTIQDRDEVSGFLTVFKQKPQKTKKKKTKAVWLRQMGCSIKVNSTIIFWTLSTLFLI